MDPIQPIKFIQKQEKSIYDSNCIEFWKPITSQVLNYPIEENRYWISTYGRIYDSCNGANIYLSHHAKGYIQLLITENSKIVCTRKLHRIVMMTFCYFPGCESLQVNHKDGIKTHNWLSNLEWNTGSENRIHAIDNNLGNMIFGVPIVKLTPDEVWDIKLLHWQGYSANQIIDMLNIREKGAHRKLIYKIVNGKSKLYSGDFI